MLIYLDTQNTNFVNKNFNLYYYYKLTKKGQIIRKQTPLKAVIFSIDNYCRDQRLDST